MVNLGIMPYLASKLSCLAIIVGCNAFCCLPAENFDLIGAMSMPENLGGPAILDDDLTAGVGIALGLLISALVKTSNGDEYGSVDFDSANTVSGLVGVPSGASKIVSLTSRQHGSLIR